jgi:hypothetical protein
MLIRGTCEVIGFRIDCNDLVQVVIVEERMSRDEQLNWCYTERGVPCCDMRFLSNCHL